jgi:lipopolysaccharide transport system ATP-binding protein
VAAHLDPEILIVDEVLAVGDADFQKKCLGKMGDVATQGRTVLFVSHNMQAIEHLCTRALLLRDGRIARNDRCTSDAIKHYLGGDDDSSAASWTRAANQASNTHHPTLTVTRFWIGDDSGNVVAMPADRNSSLWVCIEADVHSPDPGLNLGYAISSDAGVLLYWSLTTDDAMDQWPRLKAGTTRIRSRLPASMLNEGVFHIELIASLHYREWIHEPGVNSPAISVSLRGRFSESPLWMTRRPGVLAPCFKWKSC